MAGRVRFLRGWDERPHPRRMIFHPSGSVALLPQKEFERAVAEGAVEVLPLLPNVEPVVQEEPNG